MKFQRTGKGQWKDDVTGSVWDFIEFLVPIQLIGDMVNAPDSAEVHKIEEGKARVERPPAVSISPSSATMSSEPVPITHAKSAAGIEPKPRRTRRK